MRPFSRPVALAVAFVLSSACSGGGGGGNGDDDDYVETGRVEITLIVPPATPAGQDPFEGVTQFHLAILGSTGTPIVEADFDADGPFEIQSLEPGDDRVVVFEGRNAAGTPISRGRTLPIDIFEGSTPVQASLYLSRVGAFATVYGAPASRTGASTWTFSDGRVLIAGGLDGAGVALASAEIFDWESDSVVAAGTMTSAHAFAATASLANDTLLIAGGVTDLSPGTPTAVADVYTHVPGGVGTWAVGVPSMTVARRELGAGAMGAGRALVAGGTSTTATTGPPLDTLALFEWNGSTGTWTTPAVTMQAPRMGPVVLPLANGQVLIGGGFSNESGGGGNNVFSRTIDVFSFGGSVTISDTDQFAIRRGWRGVLALGGDEWLVWGGQDANGLLADAQIIGWNGTSLQEQNQLDLPAAQRGGAAGVLSGNQILLLGGNTSTYPAMTPSSTAAIFAGGNFTNFSPSPGPSLGGTAAPLPDGTSLVVIDGAVLRFNPL